MPIVPDLVTFRGSAVVLVEGETVLDVGDDTRHMVASVSKQFIAVAVLLAQHEGLLDLSDGVRRFVPELGSNYDAVTIHHLLTHTSGVRHWDAKVRGLWIADDGTAADRIAVLARTPLLSAPGREWHYSSVGYALLTSVIESATGATYADVVRERLTGPAGLSSTTVGPPEPGVPAATGHRSGRPVPAAELASTDGTGYVWSTARDLARWTERLHGGLIPDEVHALLVHPHVTIPEDDPQDITLTYGYGLFLGTLAAHRAWFHPGDNPGFCALTAYLPDLRVSLALVSSQQETDTDELAARLVDYAAHTVHA